MDPDAFARFASSSRCAVPCSKASSQPPPVPSTVHARPAELPPPPTSSWACQKDGSGRPCGGTSTSLKNPKSTYMPSLRSGGHGSNHVSASPWKDSRRAHMWAMQVQVCPRKAAQRFTPPSSRPSSSGYSACTLLTRSSCAPCPPAARRGRGGTPPPETAPCAAGVGWSSRRVEASCGCFRRLVVGSEPLCPQLPPTALRCLAGGLYCMAAWRRRGPQAAPAPPPCAHL